MKLLLFLVIIVGCGYIGYGISLYFRRRHSFFCKFLFFIDKLSADICFCQNKLGEIFQTDDFIDDPILKKLAKNYLLYLNDKDIELTEETLFIGINIIRKEEKNIIFLFFKSLGKHDIENQENLISSYRCKIQTFADITYCENNKYSSMCVKLGIMIGAVIALILI